MYVKWTNFTFTHVYIWYKLDHGKFKWSVMYLLDSTVVP